MASVMKMTADEVVATLKHNARDYKHPPKNQEINADLSDLNYHLTPESHGRSAAEAKDYYKQRLSEIYVYGRKDVITLCQWVCTAPADLSPEQEKDFFKETYKYLNSLYGEVNCVQAVVHYDEGIRDPEGKVLFGKGHLHYAFIPAITNDKYGIDGKCGPTASSSYEEKLGANQLIRISTLREFHPAYQAWLDRAGVKCKVHTGITGGKNRTVKDLKKETKAMLQERERVREWGRSDSWGREKEVSVWDR